MEAYLVVITSCFAILISDYFLEFIESSWIGKPLRGGVSWLWSYKPFSCAKCMSIWIGVFLTLINFDYIYCKIHSSIHINYSKKFEVRVSHYNCVN